MLPPLILAVVAAIVILIILWAAGVFKKKVGYRLRQNFKNSFYGNGSKGKQKLISSSFGNGSGGWLSNNYIPTDPSYTANFWGTNYPQITQVVGTGGLSLIGMGYDLRVNNMLQASTAWTPSTVRMFSTFNLITDNGQCIWWNPESIRSMTPSFSQNSTDSKSTISDTFGLKGNAVYDAINITASLNGSTNQSTESTTDTSTYLLNIFQQTGSLMLAQDSPGSSNVGNQYCLTNSLSTTIWQDLHDMVSSSNVDGQSIPSNIWYSDSSGVGPLNDGLLAGLDKFIVKYGSHIVTQINLGTKFSLMSYSYLGTEVSQDDFQLDMCINLSPASPQKPGGTTGCPPVNNCAGVQCPTGTTCNPTNGICATTPPSAPTVRMVQGYKQKASKLKDDPPTACPPTCPTGQTCDPTTLQCSATPASCDPAFSFAACNGYTSSQLSQSRNSNISHNSYILGGSQDAQNAITQAGDDPLNIPLSTLVTFLDSASDPASTAAIGFILQPIFDILNSAITNIFDRNSDGNTYPADQADIIMKWVLSIDLSWWQQAILLLQLGYVQSTACPSSNVNGVPFTWLDCTNKDASGNCAGSPYNNGGGDVLYQCNTRSGTGCTDVYGGESCAWGFLAAKCMNYGSGLHQVNSLYTCVPGTSTPTTYGVPDSEIDGEYGCGEDDGCKCSDNGNSLSVIWDTAGKYDCTG